MRFWKRFHLRRSLNRLCKKLDNHFYINSGGCCFVAAIIAKNLEQLNIPYKVIIASDYEEIDYSGEENIINKRLDKFPTGIYTQYHYFIKIDTGVINKSDCDSDLSYLVYSKINSNDLKWIYETGSWNDCFDIDNKNIVAYEINKLFKRYEEK